MFYELSVLHSNPMCQYFTAVNRFKSLGAGRKVYSEPFVWDTSLKSDGEGLGEVRTGTRQNVCQDCLALSQGSEVFK